MDPVVVGTVFVVVGAAVLRFVLRRPKNAPEETVAEQVDAGLDVYAEDLHNPDECELCAIDDMDLACIYADIVFAHRAREFTGFYAVKPPVIPGRDEP